MSLKTRITEDMKNAMKAKDARRLGAVRLLLAAMKQREVDERIELSDGDVLTIIEKMLKQRRDSIAQYQTAGRQDLVDQENFEVEILTAYMPQQATEAEVAAALEQAVQSTDAKSMGDMGKVMAALKTSLAGRADMAKLSAMVKRRLSA
ncbi:MAG TPA: GatB/YqeY domain-containing protein [Burkholderiales bacterium]|nr:GatB/YqeY domain-containing protein [Burkholderiales bacterium]